VSSGDLKADLQIIDLLLKEASRDISVRRAIDEEGR